MTSSNSVSAPVSKVGSNSSYVSSNLCSKLKIYRFAIAIMMTVGAIGLAGYFHVGVLANMTQVDAIGTIGSSGVGIILLIIGLVAATKNRKSDSHKPDLNAGPTPTPESVPVAGSAIGKPYLIDSIYGAQAWKDWKNVEIVEIVPVLPRVDWNKNDQILFYLPKTIKVNGGKEQILTLKVLIGLTQTDDRPFLYHNKDFQYCSEYVIDAFGNQSADIGRWILMDKQVMSGTQQENYATQQKKIGEGRIPRVLEAVALHLMVRALTKKPLYENVELGQYTRCIEQVDNTYLVSVGGEPSSQGLSVIINSPNVSFSWYGKNYGVMRITRL